MLFSVIIPTYNSSNYIEECLESILNQKIKDFEIIVIDDGNKDTTNKIVLSYKKQFKNIKLLKNKNKGVSAARNLGISVARGEYIIFVDSDDVISENLFETIFPYCQKGYDCIKYNAKYLGGNFDPNDDRFICTPFENLTGEMALERFCTEQKIFATPWMYSIKKQVYIANNLVFPEGRVHEDVAIMPLAIAFSKLVCSLDFVGYTYIQHKQSIMNDRSYQKKLERAYDFLAHYDYLHQRLDNSATNENAKKIFYNYLSKRINCKIDHLEGEDKTSFVNQLNARQVDSFILDGEKTARKYK